MLKQLSNMGTDKLMLYIIGSVLLLNFFNYANYNRVEAIRHDMTSYYGYLPALIIYQDPDLTFVENDTLGRYTWISHAQNGPVFRMTMGTAFLNAPFFLLADGIARVFDFERTGYSKVYLFLVLLAPIFYCLWGLLLIRKILSKHFNEITIAFVSVLLVFGTNLWYYTIQEGLMSHVYLFFLYAALWYNSAKWYRQPAVGNSILLGLIIGLLVLIRPIHMAATVLFALYNIKSVKERLQFLLSNTRFVLLMAVCAFCVVLPQMIYWKVQSGQWFYYSYDKEGFFFLEPMILKGWFGFRKGWMIYTPVMLLIIPGFYILFRQYKTLARPLLIYLLIISYLTFSWWCWWYGGSYGSRPMIDIYALMTIPLAAAIQWLWTKKMTRIVLIILSVFFLFHNFFQVRQYQSSLLHWDSMNFKLYKTIFLTQKFPENYEELLTPPDVEAAMQGERDF